MNDPFDGYREDVVTGDVQNDPLNLAEYLDEWKHFNAKHLSLAQLEALEGLNPQAPEIIESEER